MAKELISIQRCVNAVERSSASQSPFTPKHSFSVMKTKKRLLNCIFISKSILLFIHSNVVLLSRFGRRWQGKKVIWQIFLFNILSQYLKFNQGSRTTSGKLKNAFFKVFVKNISEYIFQYSSENENCST